MSTLDIVKEHREEYDRDCSEHNGCSCGWQSEDGMYHVLLGIARDEWAQHFAAVLATWIDAKAEK